MGLRHRSIRLRVGLLITVPVLCLLAVYGFASAITLGSAVTQQHARSLKSSLADPIAQFQLMVAKERYLALLSLVSPTNTQVASELGVQEGRTQRALATLTAALEAPEVAGYASEPEKSAIRNLRSVASIGNLNAIRGRVADDAITIPEALADYDKVINAGYQVIDEALSQQTSVPFVTQALNVVDLDRASGAAQEEWDLLSADLALGKLSNADRIALAQIAGQRQTIVNTTVPELSPQLSAILTRYVPSATAGNMTIAETRVINTSWRRGRPPAQLTAARATFQDYQLGLGKALAAAGAALQQQATNNANTVILELVLAAGLGLVGTIASIALSLVIGRGLVRQLRGLRESALTLAHEKLPTVISKLRSGEQVEIADYAPGAVSSSSEIEQVQHAFAIVQQTAVQSAVDEARLRRGISDVFRNLAGRSQSLLHRQLTLLDGMERRATEPEELEDLFRIDHLTTRMRRHAEGLIILSGETPARGWRQPVPLVDVLRAAVAEVEDYTRIRVLCRTGAAVAGHAVADVIHLIAELAENATVFSPPNTPVRIQGDVVGKGFAVEIEDRGLGISAGRLEEINANLASPPQFDLSGSDRLGLFIAGQLAQRHDIKITLRPSVYGGTTAIVLIPTTLVVESDAFAAGPQLTDGSEVRSAGALPGRRAALRGGAPGSGPDNGRPAPAHAGASLDGYRTGDSVFNRDSGLDHSARPDHGTALDDGAPPGHTARPDHSTRFSELGSYGNRDDFGVSDHGGNGKTNGDMTPAGTFGILAGTAGDASSGNGHYPSVDGQPGNRSAENGASSGPVSPPHEPADDVPAIDPEQIVLSSTIADRTVADRTVADRTVADPRLTGPAATGNAPSATEHELPRRVRQASLAPQLRTSGPSPAARSGSNGFGSRGFAALASRSAPAPGAGASTGTTMQSPEPPEPEAARDTMSALQRGWQLGRSEAGHGDPGRSVFAPRRSPAANGHATDPQSAAAPDMPPPDGSEKRGD